MANYNLSLPAETIDELLTWLDDKQGIIIKQTDLLSGTGQSTTATMTQKAITDALGTKADASNVYTKTQTDALLNAKADKSTTYTKTETDELIAPLATKEDVEAVEQEVAQIAGEAGLAEAVIDTDGAGTEQEFTFRKSGGDGGAYYRKIKGKTIVVDAQLASNDAEAVETTGANQWDEEWENAFIDPYTGLKSPADRVATKNFIPVLPNSTYYKKTASGFWNIYYDKNKQYINYSDPSEGVFTTPENCYYIQFSTEPGYGTTYNNDICINLSNPDINGQYFPFWKRTLQLGITTRKDTDGNVPFPNGLQSCPVAQDEATQEGGTIRVGTRAYQAGDESDANVITDGTNTNYALATPVPFTWAEPLNLGVKVDENGTERAVAPEGATAPSAPFVADTTYTMSVARMVEKLQNL